MIVMRTQHHCHRRVTGDENIRADDDVTGRISRTKRRRRCLHFLAYRWRQRTSWVSM